MICVIGEILFDIFPNYKRLGGAPFNFAFHLKKMQLPVHFFSRIGNDEKGMEILETLKEHNFNTDYIQLDHIAKTGSVIVSLDQYGNPEFNIEQNVAYDAIEMSPEILAAIQNESLKLIYFGTLVQRTEKCFQTVQKVLDKKGPNAKCFYDINLRPSCYNKKVIEASLHHADILKLNDQELQEIRQLFGYQKKEKSSFLKYLIDHYAIEIIALTKGKQGSEIYCPLGHYETIPDVNSQIVDAVGAGDAFASVLAMGYLNKWSPDQILKTATAFASYICQVPGALPSDDSVYSKISNKRMSQ